MTNRPLDGGSIGYIIRICKKHVRVGHSLFQRLLLSKQEKSIVQKSVFINFVKSLFGIKDLKGFIFHQVLSLKKVFIILQKQNLKKVINLKGRFKKVREFLLKQNLKKISLRGIKGNNVLKYKAISIGVLLLVRVRMLVKCKELKNRFVNYAALLESGVGQFMFIIRIKIGITTI